MTVYFVFMLLYLCAAALYNGDPAVSDREAKTVLVFTPIWPAGLAVMLFNMASRLWWEHSLNSEMKKVERDTVRRTK